MPLYEYHCEACSADFELLVRASTEVRCPHCESVALHKKWSSFAAKGDSVPSAAAGGHSHGGGCGCCGGAPAGSCGLN